MIISDTKLMSFSRVDLALGIQTVVYMVFC